LLKEAGYPDGFEITIVTPNKPYREKWAQIMQAQLADVGIKAQIEKLEWGTYSAKVSAGDADIYLLAWTWYPDPDFFLTQFFHSGRVGTLGNGQGYVNEEVTALLDAAINDTADQDERAEMYRKVIELTLKETPRIEGWHKQLNYGLSASVQDYTVSPDDSILLVTPERNVYKSN
jgi:peptide/nickel transport system substrate-binding protein